MPWNWTLVFRGSQASSHRAQPQRHASCSSLAMPHSYPDSSVTWGSSDTFRRLTPRSDSAPQGSIAFSLYWAQKANARALAQGPGMGLSICPFRVREWSSWHFLSVRGPRTCQESAGGRAPQASSPFLMSESSCYWIFKLPNSKSSWGPRASLAPLTLRPANHPFRPQRACLKSCSPLLACSDWYDVSSGSSRPRTSLWRSSAEAKR